MAKIKPNRNREWWRKLPTAPGVIATTALTASVGAGVTWTIDTAREGQFQPSDPIKISLETDPGKMNSVADSYLRPVIIPHLSKPRARRRIWDVLASHRWAVESHGVDAGETVLGDRRARRNRETHPDSKYACRDYRQITADVWYRRDVQQSGNCTTARD
jgi:hypothetical protein